jgi:DUF1016 N-terminal domain
MKTELDTINPLSLKIAELIELFHQKVVTTANLAIVNIYLEIGRMIVEEEQQGKSRAEYGKVVLKNLSDRLVNKFGKGFSERNLEQMRQFYLVYYIMVALSCINA